jgi:uncharacterized GH25 family protein
MRILAFALCLSGAAIAQDRVTLTGKITDPAGHPLEHATVLVYHAGVKVGYSTFCPSCYSDCGKRTLTGADGSYRIAGLSPDLWFELLVVHAGYRPEIAKNRADIVLRPRPAAIDATRIVRGRVVTAKGTPLRDAVITPRGLAYNTPRGIAQVFGSPRGVDPIAATDEHGEFELASDGPVLSMELLVEARGMATKLQEVAAGAEIHALEVTDGAMIRGRVVQDGKPVPGIEMALYSRDHINGSGYDEVRIGTREDGSFAFTNVPAPENWYVFGKMESISARGAIQPLETPTHRDGEEIDLGDIAMQPGHRLRGKVVLPGGKPVPAGMRIFITPGCMSCLKEFGHFGLLDAQTVELGADGAFEFTHLATGPYQITVSVKGYALAEDPAILLPLDTVGYDAPAIKVFQEGNGRTLKAINSIERRITGDVDGLVIALVPH